MQRYSLFVLGIALALAAMTQSFGTDAKCPPGGCSSGQDDWQKAAQEFINSDVPGIETSSSTNSGSGNFDAGQPVGSSVSSTSSGTSGNTKSSTVSNADFVEADSRAGLFLKGEYLKPLSGISQSDTMVDVSNQRSKNDGNIIGAINIPSKSFLNDDGTLKSVADAAKVLGNAGISSRDSVIVYSDNFSSGESTFVFWLLRYLGHEDVRALDGGLEDWKKASLPLETKQNARNPTEYTPNPEQELLADYDYVTSGSAQLVDARDFLEYGKGRIPGAAYIGTESLLEDGRLKSGSELNDTFAKLKINRPVVVYSSDFMSASLVWYALQLMGFDSRVYSWQDWQAHK
ncbi:MAG: sulfurtransferase [Methanothrix sp.]|nr:MAG: sulfurtransferase [Methanothrix sp.]